LSNAMAFGWVLGGRCFELLVTGPMGAGVFGKWSAVLVFPRQVGNHGEASDVAPGKRSSDPSFPPWHAPDVPHVARPGPRDARGARPSRRASPLVIHPTGVQASQLPSCHPAIHPVHQPEGTLIAP